MIPPKPTDETQRLEIVRGYEILDTGPEAAFDDEAKVTHKICPDCSRSISA